MSDHHKNATTAISTKSSEWLNCGSSNYDTLQPFSVISQLFRNAGFDYNVPKDISTTALTQLKDPRARGVFPYAIGYYQSCFGTSDGKILDHVTVMAANELWGPTCISFIAEAIPESGSRLGNIINLIDGVEQDSSSASVIYRAIVRTNISFKIVQFTNQDLFTPMPSTVPLEDLLNIGKDVFLKKSILSFVLKQYIESLVHDRQNRTAGEMGLGSMSTLVSNVSHPRSNASPTSNNHGVSLSRHDSQSRKTCYSHQNSPIKSSYQHPLISPIRMGKGPFLVTNSSNLVNNSSDSCPGSSPEKKNDGTSLTSETADSAAQSDFNSTVGSTNPGYINILAKSTHFSLRPNCQVPLDGQMSTGTEQRWQGFDIESMVNQLDQVTDSAIIDALTNLENVNQPRIYNVDVVYDYEEGFDPSNQNPNSWSIFKKALGTEIGRSDYLKESFRFKNNQSLAKNGLDIPTFQSLDSDSLASQKSLQVMAEIDSQTMKERRSNIIYEFIDTEESYVKSIKFIEDVYMNALKPNSYASSSNSTSSNKLLPPFEYRIIFSNAPNIIRLNSDFFADIAKMKGQGDVEEAFLDVILKHMEKFKVYADYVSSLKMSQDTLKKFEAESIPFRQFLNERRVFSDRHYLADLLVYPVQRIPRYILLLKDLVKNTWVTSPFREKAEIAATGFLQLGAFLNDATRKQDATTKSFQVYEMVENCPATIINAKRWFISKIDCNELDNFTGRLEMEATMFLFNDMLLLTKRRESSVQAGDAVEWKDVKEGNSGVMGGGSSSAEGGASGATGFLARKKPYKAIALFSISNLEQYDAKMSDLNAFKIKITGKPEWLHKSKNPSESMTALLRLCPTNRDEQRSSLKNAEPLPPSSSSGEPVSQVEMTFTAIHHESKKSWLKTVQSACHDLKFSSESKASVFTQKWKDNMDIYFHVYGINDYKSSIVKNPMVIIYQDQDLLKEGNLKTFTDQNVLGVVQPNKDSFRCMFMSTIKLYDDEYEVSDCLETKYMALESFQKHFLQKITDIQTAIYGRSPFNKEMLRQRSRVLDSIVKSFSSISNSYSASLYKLIRSKSMRASSAGGQGLGSSGRLSNSSSNSNLTNLATLSSSLGSSSMTAPPSASLSSSKSSISNSFSNSNLSRNPSLVQRVSAKFGRDLLKRNGVKEMKRTSSNASVSSIRSVQMTSDTRSVIRQPASTGNLSSSPFEDSVEDSASTSKTARKLFRSASTMTLPKNLKKLMINALTRSTKTEPSSHGDNETELENSKRPVSASVLLTKSSALNRTDGNARKPIPSFETILKDKEGSSSVLCDMDPMEILQSMLIPILKEIEQKSLTEEGAYRREPSIRELKTIQPVLLQQNNPNNPAIARKRAELLDSLDTLDLPLLTGLVKTIIRQLPVPLFPSSLVKHLESGSSPEIQDHLEDPAYSILRECCLHLFRITKLPVSRMTSDSLAKILGTTLFHSSPIPVVNADGGTLSPSSALFMASMVKNLIERAPELFSKGQKQQKPEPVLSSKKADRLQANLLSHLTRKRSQSLPMNGNNNGATVSATINIRSIIMRDQKGADLQNTMEDFKTSSSSSLSSSSLASSSFGLLKNLKIGIHSKTGLKLSNSAWLQTSSRNNETPNL